MILQNIAFPPDETSEKELYIRCSEASKWTSSLGIIRQGEAISTDTYMNAFDIGVWKKYTHITDLSLVCRMKGKGTLKIYWEKENAEAVCLTEMVLENQSNIPEEKKYSFQEFPQLEEGILYFEFYAVTDSFVDAWFETENTGRRAIKISIVICTYQRKKQLERIIDEIRKMDKNTAAERDSHPGDWLHTIVIDNGSELADEYGKGITVYHNPNTGGSGGFARGMKETVRNLSAFHATHVVLMDDDVILHRESIYRLYALLTYFRPEYEQETVAGRMFRLDRPRIQYTALESWNGGDIRHIGWDQDMTDRQNLWNMNVNDGGEYSGWWFACFPIEFVKENEPLPFFLHCDDVDYGLRHGGTPVILNGIQVWHETHEYRAKAILEYYDCRNSRFINSRYGWEKEPAEEYRKWKSEISKAHVKEDFVLEYMRIRALGDYLRGYGWLSGQDGSKLHRKLNRVRTGRIRNAILWRIVSLCFWVKRGGLVYSGSPGKNGSNAVTDCDLHGSKPFS